MDSIQRDVVDNVKTLLKLSHRTQAQLAAHLGMGESAVSKRFAGSVDLDLPEIRKMAEFFGDYVTAFDLVKPHDDFRAWIAKNNRVLIDLAREGVLTRSDQAESPIGWTRERVVQPTLWDELTGLIRPEIVTYVRTDEVTSERRELVPAA